MQPYEDYAKEFEEAFEKLKEITPSPGNVNDLQSEDDELEFVKAFRNLMRLKNILTSFADFTWDDLQMPEQEFEDFKSKYLDIYESTKVTKERVSILEDVDFELELIHRDEINVNYIIQLLIKLKSQNKGDTEKTKREIANLLSTETTLRSKRELIERFIEENLPLITDTDEVTSEFDRYWDKERKLAFEKIISEENLSKEKTEKLIEDYLFAEREPLRDDLLDLIEGEKPSVLQRKKRGDSILLRIKDFVETFINGMVG